MKKPMVILGVLLSFGGCLLWGMCGMTAKPARLGGQVSFGYWNSSCITGDERYLAAAGDHAALIELSTGKIVERVPGMVKAIGCEKSAATVVGYDVAWRLPGKSAVSPVPIITGDAVAMTEAGGWVSWTRTISAQKWRGPAGLFVTSVGQSRRLDLVPTLFGKIGEARALPTPDTFAVRLGPLLEDGRILAVAGWQPSMSAGTVEDVPWGFFAVNLSTGEAAALTLPLSSDAAINQTWVQKIGATEDASDLVVAAHDGKQISVATFAQGADRPTRVTSIPSAGAANAVAISANGSWIAVGSESKGRDATATAWVLDQAGKVIWKAQLAKTIVGLHFLLDGSLVVSSADAKAVRVTLPEGKELWRAQ